MNETYGVVLAGTRKIEGVRSLITNKIVFAPLTHTLEGIDALIFTSAYAIKSLIESASQNLPNTLHFSPILAHWKEIPSFVISPASAKILYEQGAKVEFVGKSAHGKTFAQEIIPLLQGRRALYLRAKEIVSGLDSILKNAGICIEEAIMYENIPQKLPLELKPKPKSVIIFSAPSAYDSFVANFGWEDLYIAIAIGQSTFARFDKHITAYVSPSANFESCIAFAKDIARERNF
ncbi:MULTISPECIES: uroporphyrinogen-III synthase [Helicobacter]|uniref:Uroporphyrinogen-III synthase n=4 Tax=Helicobacter typhlonius TaxID=76936 RepID=A0A099UDY6_9HELI|nr:MULTISPECIES: uroporphyrinogen-III synthase [Helicobacter]TLD78651.1 uroporphyrinogen-III synthase [Helicobacter typhlonius]TLD89440.1 uroporphyrinogen-III synthase [Helicobacter sp. MIT 03-1616]CUU40082.1 Uroporphyrinogen-III synthase [Helicobacter typhlonius]